MPNIWKRREQHVWGKIFTNHLTVLPKKHQTLMLIDAHLRKTNTKPPCILLSLSSPLSAALPCARVHVVWFWCMKTQWSTWTDLHYSHEGKGWHVNTVIWHCTHLDWFKDHFEAVGQDRAFPEDSWSICHFPFFNLAENHSSVALTETYKPHYLINALCQNIKIPVGLSSITH